MTIWQKKHCLKLVEPFFTIWLKSAITAQNCEIKVIQPHQVFPLFFSPSHFFPICFLFCWAITRHHLGCKSFKTQDLTWSSKLDPRNLILYLGQLLKILTCEHGILQILTWQALLIHLQLKFLAGIAMYNLCLLPY